MSVHMCCLPRVNNRGVIFCRHLSFSAVSVQLLSLLLIPQNTQLTFSLFLSSSSPATLLIDFPRFCSHSVSCFSSLLCNVKHINYYIYIYTSLAVRSETKPSSVKTVCGQEYPTSICRGLWLNCTESIYVCNTHVAVNLAEEKETYLQL